MSEDKFDTPLDYKDRRASLIISGIILAVIGCMVGLMAAVYGFMLTLLGTGSGGLHAELEEMFSGEFRKFIMIGVGIYGAIAIAYLIVGAGNIFMKRWSRPLALILAAVWAYVGLVSILSTLITMPKMNEMMYKDMANDGPAMPSGMSMDAFTSIILIINVVFMFIFGVLLPGLIFWLNMSRDARVTLEVCDPKPRWTDRCPVPILGIAVVAASSGLMILGSAFWMPVMPVFGHLFTGQTATLVMLGIGAVMLFIAWGAFRKQVIAWVLSVGFIVLGTISAVITLPRIDWAEMYDMMGLPMDEETTQEMVETAEAIYAGPGMIALMVLAMLMMLAYLIWALRFFKGVPEPDASSPASG